jgi:predicted DNA-binding protein
VDETGDLTLEIPEELYERLKAHAARRSKIAEDLVRDLIEARDHQTPPRSPR